MAKAFAKYSAKLSLCDSSTEKEVLDVLAKDCKEMGSNKTEVRSRSVLHRIELKYAKYLD